MQYKTPSEYRDTPENDWERDLALLWGIAPPESLKYKKGEEIKQFIRTILTKYKYTQWDMDNEYARGYNEGAYETRKVYEMAKEN